MNPLYLNDAGALDAPIARLRDELTDLADAQSRIIDAAAAEDRDLDSEEQAQLDSLIAGFRDRQTHLERLEAAQRQRAILSASAGRRSAGEPVDIGAAQPQAAGNSNVARSPKGGFRSFGEFSRAVAVAMNPASGRRADERLLNAPTTVGTTTGGSGADGGYAIPPDFREQIRQAVFGERSLASLCDVYQTVANKITIPSDETTPWQTSGGILTEWLAEATQAAQSKPLLGEKEVTLHKLSTLVPVSDELLSDAPLLDSYMTRKVPEKMGHAVNLAILSGSGTGQPEGVLNSAAKVEVAKETGQAADTIVFENLIKMEARMYEGYASYVWFANPNTKTQLRQASFRDGAASGGAPVYLSGAGQGFPNIAGAAPDTLLGRPIYYTQAAETLGDAGDIVLVDLGQYLLAEKVAGIQDATSMHLWFDYYVTAFRFMMRVGGETWLDSAITPRVGSDDLSSVITLAARA